MNYAIKRNKEAPPNNDVGTVRERCVVLINVEDSKRESNLSCAHVEVVSQDMIRNLLFTLSNEGQPTPSVITGWCMV